MNGVVKMQMQAGVDDPHHRALQTGSSTTRYTCICETTDHNGSALLYARGPSCFGDAMYTSGRDIVSRKPITAFRIVLNKSLSSFTAHNQVRRCSRHKLTAIVSSFCGSSGMFCAWRCVLALTATASASSRLVAASAVVMVVVATSVSAGAIMNSLCPTASSCAKRFR